MEEVAFRRLVDDVRERTDIVALIKETVDLETAGSVLKGRSPFNRDENPSLVIWPHTGTWRDFSGGDSVGGDCFEFVQRRDGISFMETLRLLAAKVGGRGIEASLLPAIAAIDGAVDAFAPKVAAEAAHKEGTIVGEIGRDGQVEGQIVAFGQAAPQLHPGLAAISCSI